MPDLDLKLLRTGGLSPDYYNVANQLKPLYTGESNKIRLILTSNGGYQYIPAEAVTFTVIFGQPDQGPARGEWQIATGAATATAVSFNATTTQLLNAISSVYGAVNITTYGSTVTAGYIITAATANTALTINGQSLSLVPSSTVEVINFVTPSTGVTAQKLVRLRRNPAISATQYLNVASFSFTTISASGPSSVCGPWYVAIPADAVDYPEMLSFYPSLSGSVTAASIYPGFIYSNQRRENLVDGTAGTATSRGIVRRQLEDSSLRNASSAGGLVAKNPQSGTLFNTTTFYGTTLGDFVGFRVEAWQDKGLKITAVPVTSGIITALTMGGSAGRYLLSQGYYDMGYFTFSGPNLEEEFREARSDRVSLTMEITLEENGKKNNLAQLPVTIIRSIG